MKFAFVAQHRTIWLVSRLCKALDVSSSGFHDWFNRAPAKRTLENETVLGLIRRSFLESDRTYGARRVWKDVLAEGVSCGLHRIERLMPDVSPSAPQHDEQSPVGEPSALAHLVVVLQSSRARSRFASDTSMPPNLAFQLYSGASEMPCLRGKSPVSFLRAGL